MLADVRRLRLIAPLLLVLLVAASASYTSGYTLEIVDNQGRPHVAYALYSHQGHWLNPVHPVSYNATERTFVRSEDEGRLTVPGAFHLHLPFPIQTHPRLSIDMVYVPALHNAGGQIAPSYVPSVAGVWEMDPTGHRAVVYDLSDDPERWQGTISNLSFFLGPLLSPLSPELDPAAAATLVELIGHYRAEYEGFLARHDAAPRPRPQEPVTFINEDDKRRWIEMVENDLGQRPTWGMEIRRLYEHQIASLADIEAALKP